MLQKYWEQFCNVTFLYFSINLNRPLQNFQVDWKVVQSVFLFVQFVAGAMSGDSEAGTGFMAGSTDSGTSEQSSASAFTLWLQNQFAKRDDLDSKIAALAKKLNEQIKSESEAAAMAAVLAAGVNEGQKSGSTSNVLVMANDTGLTEAVSILGKSTLSGNTL